MNIWPMMALEDQPVGHSDQYAKLEEFVRTNLHKPASVLIAEDEDAFRGVMKMALEAKGCKVFEARDGQEAIELLDKNPSIAGVLLDYRMPRVDGLQVFRHIRKKTKTLPVMIVTGYATSPELAEIPRIGVSMIAEKPISLEEIDMFIQAITE